MLRVRSSGNLRSGEFGPFAAAAFFFSAVAVAIKLPAEMRKRAVRLRHFVCVFAFLDRVALAGGGGFDFLRERVRHPHSLRLSEYWTIQRVAREIWRAGATSMGT